MTPSSQKLLKTFTTMPIRSRAKSLAAEAPSICDVELVALVRKVSALATSAACSSSETKSHMMIAHPQAADDFQEQQPPLQQKPLVKLATPLSRDMRDRKLIFIANQA